MASNIINSTQTYKANLSIAFDYNNTRTTINSQLVSYIMINHDYENNIVPIIYINLSIPHDLYSMIVSYSGEGKFYISLSIYNVNTLNQLSLKKLDGSFDYVCSSSNPDFNSDTNSSKDSITSSGYIKLTLGLVSEDLTNTLRKSYNAIYRDIDQETLISLALEDTSAIIEPISYNKKYDTIIIPPLDSRYKFLQYIFKKDPFYNTMFRFFMDFNNSYLLSKTGSNISVGNSSVNNIIINITSSSDYNSYTEGVNKINGAYYVYINGAYANVTMDNGTNRIMDSVVTVDEDTGVEELNIDTSKDSIKKVFIRDKHAAIYKNELNSNEVMVEILKQNIDPSIFTPNKSIIISSDSKLYSDYNGSYILIYKKELYKVEANQFSISILFGLKKVGDIDPIYTTNKTTINTKNKAIAKSTSRSSSTNLNNTIEKVIR